MTSPVAHTAGQPDSCTYNGPFSDPHAFESYPVALDDDGYDEYECCDKPAHHPLHGPFVRVARDDETGNVIIALNPTAMAGLMDIFDAANLHDLSQNPDYQGFTPDRGNLASTVGYDIQGQLRDLAPYDY